MAEPFSTSIGGKILLVAGAVSIMPMGYAMTRTNNTTTHRCNHDHMPL
jgi:hypothetical protein